jgi:hypothetical protein
MHFGNPVRRMDRVSRGSADFREWLPGEVTWSIGRGCVLAFLDLGFAADFDYPAGGDAVIFRRGTHDEMHENKLPLASRPETGAGCEDDLVAADQK